MKTSFKQFIGESFDVAAPRIMLYLKFTTLFSFDEIDLLQKNSRSIVSDEFKNMFVDHPEIPKLGYMQEALTKDGVFLYFYLDSKHYTYNELKSINEKAAAIFAKHFNKEFTERMPLDPVIVMSSNIPNGISFECERVGLNCNNSPSHNSLHNIDKVIISCKTLNIYGEHLITSSVLGILNIKNLTNLHIEVNENAPSKGWSGILLDNFKKGKNVWKCQDELQDADLDEYAQL